MPCFLHFCSKFLIPIFSIKILRARYICRLAILQPTFVIIFYRSLKLKFVVRGHIRWFPKVDNLIFVLLLAKALCTGHIGKELRWHIVSKWVGGGSGLALMVKLDICTLLIVFVVLTKVGARVLSCIALRQMNFFKSLFHVGKKV